MTVWFCISPRDLSAKEWRILTTAYSTFPATSIPFNACCKSIRPNDGTFKLVQHFPSHTISSKLSSPSVCNPSFPPWSDGSVSAAKEKSKHDETQLLAERVKLLTRVYFFLMHFMFVICVLRTVAVCICIRSAKLQSSKSSKKQYFSI